MIKRPGNMPGYQAQQDQAHHAMRLGRRLIGAKPGHGAADRQGDQQGIKAIMGDGAVTLTERLWDRRGRVCACTHHAPHQQTVRVNTHPTALDAGRRRAEQNAAFHKRPRGIKAEGRRAIADTPPPFLKYGGGDFATDATRTKVQRLGGDKLPITKVVSPPRVSATLTVSTNGACKHAPCGAMRDKALFRCGCSEVGL